MGHHHWLAAVLVVLCLNLVSPVDRNKFRTCQQSSFCKRARDSQPDISPYELDLSTLTVSATSAEVVLINAKNNVRFRLEILALKDSSFRFKIREAFPLVERFEVPYVIDGSPEPEQLQVTDRTDTGFTIKTDDANKVVVVAKPFRMDFYRGDTLVVSSNARGRLRFEQTRKKPEEGAEADQNEVDDDINDNEPGTWEETFGGNTDSKPNGPQGVSLDFAFVGMDHVYGIPEHADTLSLKDTSNSDPYRLYNLDVFEYELWNPMALYAGTTFALVQYAA